MKRRGEKGEHRLPGHVERGYPKNGERWHKDLNRVRGKGPGELDERSPFSLRKASKNKRRLYESGMKGELRKIQQFPRGNGDDLKLVK